jgi:hypothetical protein
VLVEQTGHLLIQLADLLLEELHLLQRHLQEPSVPEETPIGSAASHPIACQLVLSACHRPPQTLFGIGHKAQSQFPSHLTRRLASRKSFLRPRGPRFDCACASCNVADSPEFVGNFWSAFFPGQIPNRLVIAEELKRNVIDLEGYDLVVVEVGHTDTGYTICLHVPSVGLVVAGDAAYNDVHLCLAESNAQTRRERIAALDKIESLKPRAVVAGHKRPGNDDSPKIIEETRQYIRDFDRVAGTTTTARGLYEKMLELYPDWVNPGAALWLSARGVKP